MCIVYLFFTLFVFGLSDYGWVVMAINVLFLVEFNQLDFINSLCYIYCHQS